MISCPICKSLNTEYLSTYRANHKIFLDTKKNTCFECGMVFANPMPKDSELTQYNSNYFEEAHGGSSTEGIAACFFKGFAKIRGSYISRFLIKHSLNPNKVLEVGPGQGFFAENWIKSHQGTHYSAIETDTTCHLRLSMLGVEILKSPEDIQIKQKKDLIVMSHVLEHISHPVEFIRRIAKTLSRRGVVFIEVPCRDYLYKVIDEPHLLFFDKQSLHKLLEDSGFGDIEITYHGKLLYDLKKENYFYKKLLAIRNRLIMIGLLFPFKKMENGLEMLTSLEVSILKPFKAHVEHQHPSRWIRAVAIKK